MLTGSIVRRAGGDREHYIFRDRTGEILVDIDGRHFRGRTVTSRNLVCISGEVDRESMTRTKVGVKRLEILR